MKFYDMNLLGLVLIKPSIFEDERGFFMETYQKNKFFAELDDRGFYVPDFVQDNHAYSIKGVVRGLHFQKVYPQGKLVRCIKGSIIDVVVDIRPDSNTFGEHVTVELSADNKHQLWVPRGFAHGYEVISEEAEVTYKCDDRWYPEYDSGIIWNDKSLNIKWKNENPIVSEKDKNLLTFKEMINEF